MSAQGVDERMINVHYYYYSYVILVQQSFRVPGIQKWTGRSEVADSRTGLADVLSLPIFSLFTFLSSFPSIHCITVISIYFTLGLV